MKTALKAASALLLGCGLLLAHGAKPWAVPEKARKRKNPLAATAESLRQGAALYQSNCLVCHGGAAQGDGPWVEKLMTKPANLADPQMMSEMTQGEIFWKISKGRDEMPRFEKQLSDEPRWHLVNCLRTFAREAKGDSGAHTH